MCCFNKVNLSAILLVHKRIIVYLYLGVAHFNVGQDIDCPEVFLGGFSQSLQANAGTVP